MTQGTPLSLSLSPFQLGLNHLRDRSWKIMYGGIGLGLRKAIMSFGRHLAYNSVPWWSQGKIEEKNHGIGENKEVKEELEKKNDIFVQIPESMSFLDTATMPMILSILLELHSLQSYSWWYVVTFRSWLVLDFNIDYWIKWIGFVFGNWTQWIAKLTIL
jgi:hypothetical protein